MRKGLYLLRKAGMLCEYHLDNVVETCVKPSIETHLQNSESYEIFRGAIRLFIAYLKGSEHNPCTLTMLKTAKAHEKK